ncbi:butyrophilin-like protein 10 [Mugil cephalus]|uniref:butyrophilin-like protein 10 n=1 Tax=Mugil cephalus TaxID=48193 RepID=UPI001FB6D129|nr:butyrophilin-like protein 10 [Mugil cephalus]
MMTRPLMPSDNSLSFRDIILLHAVVFIVVLQSHGVYSDLVCSRGPIAALVGDDVILPCRLEPSIRADSMTVVWTKPGLDPKYVHVHEDGRLVYQSQHPSYYYRTRLFVDELKNGNVSMKIMKVKVSDGGEYKCLIPSIKKEDYIQLIVGSVSTPIITVISNMSGRATLSCESRGWYPEPEVLWLDAEGNLLSAGPPETVRGPDHLYTVSSRVTVDKRHNNSFTCRVQQNNIHQTREAHIHVPDYFIVDSTELVDFWWLIFIAVLVVPLCILCCCRVHSKKCVCPNHQVLALSLQSSGGSMFGCIRAPQKKQKKKNTIIGKHT